MRELKKYGLRLSHKPKVHPLLSGVVQLCVLEGKTFSYVTFTEDFVDAVGRALPEGLLPNRPAYLKIMRLASDLWLVYAFYVGEEIGVLLWKADKPPDWIPDKFH